MFCACAGHLDKFCFQRKRIERRHFDYTRNSYSDAFFDFPPRSFSHALPHTSSRVLPQFAHVPNHRSYGFGLRENHFVPRRFSYDPRFHCGEHFPHRPDFAVGGSRTHPELRHLNGPHFPRHGSCPTRPNGEVQRTVKTSSDRMVNCWISKIYLTNPSTKSSTSFRPM
jgi:hypothetical protein